MAMQKHMMAYVAAAVLILVGIFLMNINPRDDNATKDKKKKMKKAGIALLVVGGVAALAGAYMQKKGASAGVFSAYMSDEF